MSDYGVNGSYSYTPDFVKDPNSIEDLEFDWSARLNGDTIQGVTFYLPDGLTSVTESFTDSAAVVFVSGGDAGAVYRVTCRISTVGGRTMDRTLRVLVEDQ
jgi:hypothetical protein